MNLAVGPNCGGQVVFNPAIQDHRSLILYPDFDFRFAVQRWGVGPASLHNELSSRGEAPQVQPGRQQDQGIPRQHGITQAPVPEPRDQQQESRREHTERAKG